MSKKKIIILGAGLAGLSAAYYLDKQGKEYSIFEKEGTVGGLCRSKKCGDFVFDYSGHLLHFKQKRTIQLIRSLLANNLTQHNRKAYVYSFDQITPYPFQANLYGLPLSVIRESILGFVERNNGKAGVNQLNFLDWINHNFGEGIARHFMIPYNRKFWRLPLDEITSEWVGNYIPLVDLHRLIESSLKKSSLRLGYNAFFWYTRDGGIEKLPLAFAKRIRNLSLNHRVSKIDIKQNKIYFDNGRREYFNRLVTTIPLVDLVNISEGVPTEVRSLARKLKWTSIFNLNLGIDRNCVSGRHWIYFPEKKFVFYRVGFPHNFSNSSAPFKSSSLYVEASYLPSEKINQSSLRSRIVEDLIKAGILLKKDRIVVEDVNDIKYGYVIFDRNYRQARRRILDFFAKRNISSIGRYGSWRYMTMEDAILDGEKAVKC